MRLITFAFMLIFSTQSISQDCNLLPSDTTVCGFKHIFQMTQEDGTFDYECEASKLISISTDSDGVAFFSFSECGTYEVIFESSLDNCLDTFRIEVNDPSTSVTSLNTSIGLGYGDIECPIDGLADCNIDVVSIDLPGNPIEVWEFCTTASCETTIFNTEAIGDEDGCLVDTITCTTNIISDSAEDCIETNQDAFIILNSNGDMVDNNSFLEYLSQLQGAVGVDCPPVIDNCFMTGDSSCYDTTMMDTTYLHIPVRLGGKWTLSNIDSVELFDTTYFDFDGGEYELILDPGVEFYGPGNLDVYLYELVISSPNDTTRKFPYGFNLELLWEEVWILDTLELIKEIPIDTTGDCMVCGGNFLNSQFNVPGIPEFPCGPVSISYPDECECESEYPDYSIQLNSCSPKSWQVDILGGSYEIHDGTGNAVVDGGFNTAYIFWASSENIELYATDNFGCEYIIPITLESITEGILAFATEQELSCELPEIELHAYHNIFYGPSEVITQGDPPVWTLPDGGTLFGSSIFISEPGYYLVEYTDISGCVYEDGITITYNDDEFVYYENAILCGDEVTFYNGQTIDQPGEYSFDIDCNESIILTVEHYDFEESYEYYNVCAFDEIMVHGQLLSAGIHFIPVENGTPCPDYVNVEIEAVAINPSWSVTYNCEGSASVLITHDSNGANYTIDNDGSYIGSYSSSGNSFDFELNSSGSYQVSIESDGCSENIIFDVELVEYQIMPLADGLLTCIDPCTTLAPDIINVRGAASPSDYAVVWDGPDGFSSTDVNIDVCLGGNYTLNLIYGEDCIVTRSFFVDESLEPEVLFISADLCYGECYDDGTYSFCQTTQTTIEVDECTRLEVDVRIAEEILSEESYSLCDGEDMIVNGVVYQQEGDYTSVFVSETGCDSTLNFSIEVLERGQITSENIIDCMHDVAILQYVPLNEIETYEWRDEGGSILSNDSDYQTDKAGSYYLEVTVIGEDNVCSFVEEFVLIENFVYPDISLEEVYTINCENSVVIDINLESGSTWIWEASDSQMYLENENLDTDIEGEYSLSVTNMEGCTTTKSIEVVQIDPIEIEFTTTSTCEGFGQGHFELEQINGGIPPFIILLDEEETGMSVDQLESGTYKLQILQADGCIYEQDITIESILDLDEIPVQNLEYCNNNGITISLNLDEVMTFNWLDGFESPVRQIREEGIYEVELSNGCSSIISTYQVEDTRVEENFVVSNIFTPEGNSSNDRMIISPQVEYQDYQLYIFSRDGSLVYKTTDIDEGWDGTIGGNRVVVGVYVWMIESNIYTCSGEIEKTQDVGTVTVIY